MKLRQTAHAWQTGLEFKKISKKWSSDLKKRGRSFTEMFYWRQEKVDMTNNQLTFLQKKDSGITYWIRMNTKFEKIRNSSRKTGTAFLKK